MKKNLISIGLLLATSTFLSGCGSLPSTSEESLSPSITSSEEPSINSEESTSSLPSTSEESPSSIESPSPSISEESASLPSEESISLVSEESTPSTSEEELSIPELGEFSLLNSSGAASGFTFDEITNTYNISTSGTYTIKGSLYGSISCAASLSSKVTLIMDGAAIFNEDGPAISWLSESKNITLSPLTHTTNYIYEGYHDISETDEDLTMSAIYSENNVNFEGAGDLYVNSRTKHAVDCSDLEFKSTGIIDLKASSDGAHAKSVVITSGTINIDSCSDGIQADKNSSLAKGIVTINGGLTTIKNSTNSAISVETTLTINVGASITLQNNAADFVYPEGGYINNGGTIINL